MGQFDDSLESSHDDFFDQILFSLPWADLNYGNSKSPWDIVPPSNGQNQKLLNALSGKPSVHHQLEGAEGIHYPQLYDESLLLASRLRQNQISGSGGASEIQLNHVSQQQALLSAMGCTAAAGDSGLLPLPLSPGNADSTDSRLLVDGSRNDVDPPFKPPGSSGGDGLYNGFGGPLQGTSHLPGAVVLPSQNYGASAVGVGQQPATEAAGVGSTPPRQRVRARRGQATDPHSIAERLRRERIAERMKALQELVPNANKTDKASMLDEIIDYVKFLQLQVKVLSMSRLGGAASSAPFPADVSSKLAAVVAQAAAGSDGMTAAEQQVAKLMEEDMGAAMQYLQGKGLCLMPISLASAISAATCHPPPLPSALSALTAHSTVAAAAAAAAAAGSEPSSSSKEAASVSKP
ncbi:unnamed protein product [Spirodela intermedia]|uniref:BHLH domain-containing protein n=1 Tax=Spirodela intermedia TaxID=51605 RepID=A0A7I8JJD3_SPIIN|nr:unnamed protein product [Spirodela intermedia]CAA6670239.1 unnamed protein product [Spirodela intermedia]